MKNKSNSEKEYGIAIFTALLALSFKFSHEELSFLVHSGYNWVIKVFLAGTFLLLLFFVKLLPKNQKLVLGIMYVMIPFSFSFRDSAPTFLFLNSQPLIAYSFLSISLLLLGSLFIEKKVKEGH